MPRNRIELLTRGFSEVCNSTQLVKQFVLSRRSGLSPRTIDNYNLYLKPEAIGTKKTCQEIQAFIDSRTCHSGGKHAYYRCLKAFYNWLYSTKSGYGLNRGDNPILDVEAPVVEKKILPSLTTEQLDFVISKAKCVRDKAIVSLFADSGLRLTELASIDPANVDWQRRLIKANCKGHKEGLAVFGARTEALMKQWLTEYTPNGTLWNVNANGIRIMINRLSADTGIEFSPHTFRRTFASILAKRNVDSLHIMRLGRWSSIQMVERYTKSVKFDDSLKFYNAVVS